MSKKHQFTAFIFIKIAGHLSSLWKDDFAGYSALYRPCIVIVN